MALKVLLEFQKRARCLVAARTNFEPTSYIQDLKQAKPLEEWRRNPEFHLRVRGSSSLEGFSACFRPIVYVSSAKICSLPESSHNCSRWDAYFPGR